MKIRPWLLILLLLFLIFIFLVLMTEKESVILPVNPHTTGLRPQLSGVGVNKSFIPPLNVSNFDASQEFQLSPQTKETIEKQPLNVNKDTTDLITNKADFLPEKSLLKVPFTSQAPFADWQPPFNETCEEAAIVMAVYWLNNKPLTPAIAKGEILDLVDYQKKNYGDYIDTTAAETARLANDFYQINNFKIKEKATINDIISELAKGNLVIAPMAGRKLANPYFRQPGPIYHMLLFVGYDKKKAQFITNDAGTKRGEGFRYSFKNIESSLADWDKEKKEPNSGRRPIIIVNPT
jgi:hypothetical protein